MITNEGWSIQLGRFKQAKRRFVRLVTITRLMASSYRDRLKSWYVVW